MNKLTDLQGTINLKRFPQRIKQVFTAGKNKENQAIVTAHRTR